MLRKIANENTCFCVPGEKPKPCLFIRARMYSGAKSLEDQLIRVLKQEAKLGVI